MNRLYKRLAVLVFWALPTHVYAANPPECHGLALLARNITANKFAEVNLHQDSPEFRRFVKAQRIRDFAQLTSGEKERLVREFTIEKLEPVMQELEKRQEAALLKSLEILGVPVKGASGYGNLQALSNLNTARIKANRKTTATAGEIAAEQNLTKNLQVQAYHNSRWVFEEYGPLLSSKQFENLGLRFGMQSEEPFNRNILKTSDQLFFRDYLGWSEKALKENPYTSEYGRIGVFPDARYVQERGWVSPFVMYPYELLLVQEKANPELYEDFEKYYRRKRPSDAQEGDMFRGPFAYYAYAGDEFLNYLKKPGKLQLALAPLRDYTFTVNDYRALVADQMAISLAELKKTNPPRYREVSRWIQEGDWWNLDQAMPELVFGPIGIREFEIKIPVAVPHDRFRSSQSGR